MTDNETVVDVVRKMRSADGGITASVLHDLARSIEAAHAREVDRAVANERVRDVHTCHDQCTKTELCRMTRRAEAAEAMSGEPGLLRLLVDLRFALGDNGKRMQDELVEYAREVYAEAHRVETMEAAIEKTLLDNLHLCDGEVCTLIELKRAIGPKRFAAIASGGRKHD